MSFKEKCQRFWRAVKTELHENRNTFMVYTGLRLLVILVMIMQIFNQNFENVFLCILTLFLMIMPSIVQVTFKMEFPSMLEILFCCLFLRLKYWVRFRPSISNFRIGIRFFIH